MTTSDPSATVLDRIVAFSDAYATAIQQRLDAVGRERFPHWGQKTTATVVFQGADGFVTFYVAPPPRLVEFPRGVVVRSRPEQSLNVICQAASLSWLSILPVELGMPFKPVTQPPPNLNPVPEGAQPWMINDDVAQALVDGTLPRGLAMAIGPLVHYNAGISEYIVPNRLHVWSPVLPVPGLGPRRLYSWTAADFWWRAEDLTIDPARAPETAATDLAVLEAILNKVGTLTVAAAPGGNATAADIWQSYCTEFETLLETQGEDEAAIHNWLKDPTHRIVWGSDIVEVWSKIPFGHDISDFVLKGIDGRYTLVEIESATKAIVKKDGTTAATFNHAVDQVSDWYRFAIEHAQVLRDDYGLDGMYMPNKMVIMGRSRDIDPTNRDVANMMKSLKNDRGITLLTYDDLLERLRNTIRRLRPAE